MLGSAFNLGRPGEAGQVYYDQASGQYYTLAPSSGFKAMAGIKDGTIDRDSLVIRGTAPYSSFYTKTPLGNTPTGSQQQPPARPAFTPNAFTTGQLGMFNNTIPQWTMDAYANRIGQMGGNANAPIPFGVNQSGFPGGGGKTGPAGGNNG